VAKEKDAQQPKANTDSTSFASDYLCGVVWYHNYKSDVGGEP
jgi:hypothetical protein